MGLDPRRMPWFQGTATRNTKSRPVLAAPHPASMAKLESAIRSGLDWQYKCSKLDRATPSTPIPPTPTSLVDPKRAGALVGVLRGERKYWRTGRDEAASSTSSTSSTSTVVQNTPKGPYGPISKALDDYREGYRQRQSRRTDKQTLCNNKPPYGCPTTDSGYPTTDSGYPTTDSGSDGSPSTCTEHCAGCGLPLGVKAAKRVTWVDVLLGDKPERVLTKRVTWSGFVQVFRIENVLDMGQL